jgi:RNA polymerase sigma-70 factor, ECF subfamily
MKMSTEEIWEEYAAKILAYFKAKVRRDDLAEDLRQEVFLRVHDNHQQLNSEQKLGNWLNVISRNVLVDHWKAIGRESKLTMDLDQNRAEVEFTQAAIDCLGGLILKLPIEYSEPLRMSELNGMKQKEVAEKLGLSISGAKSRIQRGRIMLRKSITTCCHIELNRRNELVDGECLNPDCGCAQ